MDPFRQDPIFCGLPIEPGFQEVFHCLYVMVGRFLSFFDPLCILEIKLLCGSLYPPPAGSIELEKTLFRQEKEIFHLHEHPVPDERKFRKIVIQVLHLVTVAAVDGRDGGQCVQFHNTVTSRQN